MVKCSLIIAILNNVQQQVILTLMTYVILGAILGVLYSILNKRKLAPLPPKT